MPFRQRADRSRVPLGRLFAAALAPGIGFEAATLAQPAPSPRATSPAECVDRRSATAPGPWVGNVCGYFAARQIAGLCRGANYVTNLGAGRFAIYKPDGSCTIDMLKGLPVATKAPAALPVVGAWAGDPCGYFNARKSPGRCLGADWKQVDGSTVTYFHPDGTSGKTLRRRALPMTK